MSQRLQGAAEPPLGALGCLGHASNLAFCASEECNQQVRFMEGPGTQNDGFRLTRHRNPNLQSLLPQRTQRSTKVCPGHDRSLCSFVPFVVRACPVGKEKRAAMRGCAS